MSNTKGLSLNYPGIKCLDELKQALWQDIYNLKEEGIIQYVRHGKLYLPVVDVHGDPVCMKTKTGMPANRVSAGAYKSAAADYRL